MGKQVGEWVHCFWLQQTDVLYHRFLCVSVEKQETGQRNQETALGSQNDGQERGLERISE